MHRAPNNAQNSQHKLGVAFSYLERKNNKNRRKAIFNWAAKGLFFLKGGGGYTHSGYHKTLSATIARDRTSCETET